MKKNHFSRVKRALALTLSAAMVFSGTPALGAMESMAATELDNNTNLMNGKPKISYANSHYYSGSQKSYGNSDSTGYVFGYTSSTSTSLTAPQHTFNFAALAEAINGEPEVDESKEGYTKGYGTTLKTVYGDGWWSLGYNFGPIADVAPKNISYDSTGVEVTSVQEPTNGQYKVLFPQGTEYKNGQVIEVKKNPGDATPTVEVRPEIKPSADGSYLIVEYTVANKTNQVVDFSIGNEADTQIYNHDGCPTIVTPQTNTGQRPEGLHLIANSGGTYKFTNLDILTYHPDKEINAGMQKRNATDPSETRVWAGYYSTTPRSGGVDHKTWMFGKSPAKFTNNGTDAAAAFSAYFNLNPYEIKTARFAVSMKTSVYYVDSTYTGSTANGYISTPYKSIKDAVEGIRSSGTKKAYIYLMKDTEVNEEVVIPSGIDITIETTDFTLPDNWQDVQVTANPPQRYPVDGDRKKISRAVGYNGNLFKIESSAAANTGLTIGDVTIDGGNSTTSTDSLIKAEAGWVKLRRQSVLQNNKINAKPDSSNVKTPSAIDISGTAKLDINYTTITGNTSINGSAVNFSGESFTVDNTVKIYDNSGAEAGSQANVNLAAGKVIKVNGDLGEESKLGLSVDDIPNTSEGERVAVEKARDNMPSVYSASNFSADKPGTFALDGTRTNTGKIVIKTSTYAFSVTYINAANNTSVQTGKSITNTAGTLVNEESPVVAGFIVQDVEITGNQAGLNISRYTDTSQNPRIKVEGVMPASDLIINFKYVIDQAIYKFDAQGGLPVTDLTEATGGASSSLDMPIPVRTGYDFTGWHKYTDVDNDQVYTQGTDTDLGPVNNFAPPVAGIVYFYATWTPGATQYPAVTKYRNSNANLPLVFKTITGNYHIDQVMQQVPVAVPGYVIFSANVQPARTGRFDNGHNFTGTMGISAVALNYLYKVDPNTKFNYKIVHKTPNNVLSETVTQRRAEQTVSARPINQVGLELVNAEVTQGANPIEANNVVGMVGDNSTQGSFDSDKVFTGYMPNQDVTITYTYASTAEYFVNSRYVDTTDNSTIKIESVPGVSEAPLTIHAPIVYGYLYRDAIVNPASTGNFDGTGAFNGTMPNENVRITYYMNRDPALWKDVEFKVAPAPYNNGTLGGRPLTGTFLMDNGHVDGNLSAHTFGKMEEKNIVPDATPNPAPFYRFAGWYLDAACTRAVTPDMTFEAADLTAGKLILFAKFEEDPAYWIDINFAAASHGSITGSNTLHTKLGNTWADITAQLPATTPISNYLFDKWTVDGVDVRPDTELVNGTTYTANFKPDPNAFGDNIGNIDATGKVGFDGSGEIKVHGTKANNVYIVTDLDGNILAIKKAPDPATDVKFDDLYPGTRYNVHEASPDTVANVGDHISAATGSDIGGPVPVHIPAVEGNYSIGYDPKDDEKVQLVINPADPDSDYALIDENGNVVIPEGSPDGWLSPIGSNPSTVTFTGLNPGEEYTVVARKKGTPVTPLQKKPDGTLIVANPGDEFEVPKFIVETKGGMIESVAGNPVNMTRFTEAHDNEEVVLKADSMDANMRPFKYWKVMTGYARNITGIVTTEELRFNMAKSNVVLKAVYEKALASPSNADVTEEVKGGSAGDFALDPSHIPGLENDLTTDADRVLIDENGAEVVYKIVFNKRDVKSAENALVKAVSTPGMSHPTAYHGAWALDIYADRYVNGRKVSRATPSNATTDVIVQLNAEDVDMLDYEIFDVTTGTAVQESTSENPEHTAGLFSFTATIGHTYVLVYSRAFKVRFIDNNPAMNHMHLNTGNFKHMFKVRRGEAVTDADYHMDYTIVADYAEGETAHALETPFEDIYGVQYDYVNWSKKNMPANISVFDLDRPLNGSSTIYAYYNNNRPLVEKARVDLTNLIDEATEFTNDPFLKQNEVDELRNEIAIAQAVLDKSYPTDPRMANYPELQAAFDRLKAALDRFKQISRDRNNRYRGRTGGGAGGGTGSTGKGDGSKGRPFEGVSEKSFFLGVDGNWRQNPTTGKWSFILQGGLPLNTAWGKIQYKAEDGRLLTKWYYFDGRSEMVTGWHHDTRLNKWYYLNPASGIGNGQMLTSWFKDVDGHWYYLDPVVGEMYTGWRMIGDHWYYFTPSTIAGHPAGSLYVNTVTPDGYRVNANGEWVK